MSLSVKCGTPAYMAPEMFTDGLYTRSVDMWSVGVILYRILSKGRYPFELDELKELAKNPYKDIDHKFKDIVCSRNCLHLLRSLIEPDVMKRCPHYLAIEHPFVLQEDREPDLRYYELENAHEVTIRLRQVLFLHSGVSVFDDVKAPPKHERVCLL